MSDLSDLAIVVMASMLVANVMYSLLMIAKWHATLTVDGKVEANSLWMFVVVVLPGLEAALLTGNVLAR